MTIKEFRLALQKVFADGLKIKFVGGRLEGPIGGTRPLGSCYLPTIREDNARVDEAQIIAVVRVFLPVSTSRASTTPMQPYDPEPLEDLAEKLLAVVASNQTGLGAWYQRVTSLEIDPTTQGIQATLLAYDRNRSVLPDGGIG